MLQKSTTSVTAKLIGVLFKVAILLLIAFLVYDYFMHPYNSSQHARYLVECAEETPFNSSCAMPYENWFKYQKASVRLNCESGANSELFCWLYLREK